MHVVTPDVNTAVGISGPAFPMNASDRLWVKYKLGERSKIIDPMTKQPADWAFTARIWPEGVQLPRDRPWRRFASAIHGAGIPTITIDDFTKIDLRIAKIVECKAVEGSTKLLQLTLDVGEGRHRNVFSGIASAYQPHDLVGKLTGLLSAGEVAYDHARTAVDQIGQRGRAVGAAGVDDDLGVRRREGWWRRLGRVLGRSR